MSHMRNRFNRFAEPHDRPETIVTAGIRSTQNPQKSFIPKFRSLSQPPSVSAIEQAPAQDSKQEEEKAPEQIKRSIFDNEFNDHNLVDEFKDCLESVKLELETESTTAFDMNLGSETAEEILKNIPDEVESSQVSEKVHQSLPSPLQRTTGKMSGPIKSLSRKNSSSGIPISMSAPCKPTNKTGVNPAKPAQPRRIGAPPPTMLSASRRQTSKESTAMTRNQSPKTTSARNYDLFIAKKKRYDMLRKDVQDKHKPLIELYGTLLQLKKKLEESGKQVTLEPIPFEIEAKQEEKVKEKEKVEEKLTQVEVSDVPGSEGFNIDLRVLNDVKKSVEEIRLNSVELCKNMMEKRNDLLTAFENIAGIDSNNNTNNKLLEELETHKNENAALEVFLKKTIFEQENELRDMLGKLSHLSASGPESTPASASSTELSDALQRNIQELKEYEKTIRRLEIELSVAQDDVNKMKETSNAGQACGDALRSENDKLKHKISSLEKVIDTERKKAVHEGDKYKNAELGSKAMKAKIKELENHKQQNECKITQLNQDLRAANNKIKLNERNYEKEIAELNKSRNLDKSVIERLNRDKSTFEARLTVANQNEELMREEHRDIEKQLRYDLEFARKECDVQTNTVGQFKMECDKLKDDLQNLHMHAKQSSQLTRRKDEINKTSLTERECELQIEVVAQRAAIKALQEKVDANSMEKLRFIETIEKMNGSTESRDDIVKTLVKKEEEITQLHQYLKKKDEELTNKRIENQNLRVKVDHLNEHVQMIQHEDEDDLKHMIKEGRSKLEEALMKSLENEHKMIKYEHELSQKIQTVTKLENTLKLRDGLIGLLKTKKEELAMENKSLIKYSEEIRKFVIESKEELKQKTEIINELQTALNHKASDMHTLEKQYQELEGQLAVTNEKRYKLQDTVSCMEKELYAAKAEPETRYDDTTTTGRISQSEVELIIEKPIGLQPWNAASTTLYNQYKDAYVNRQINNAQSMSSIASATYRCYNSTTCATHSRCEELNFEAHERGAPEVADDYNRLMQLQLPQKPQSCCMLQQTYLNSNFRAAGEGSMQFYPGPANEALGSGLEYAPMTFAGIDKYQVADRGHLCWLAPSANMKINNSIITKDLFAHSCSKIKNNLDNSLRRLNETRNSYH